MKNDAHKVGLAAAIGAALGALVASKLGSWYWVIGPLLGALVGYLSYEFKVVLRAIPAAFQAAHGWRFAARKSVLRLIAWTFPAVLLLAMDVIALIAVSARVWNDPHWLDAMLFIWMIVTGNGFLMALVPGSYDLVLTEGMIEEKIRKARKLLIGGFPPILACLVLYGILYGLVWVLKHLPKAAWVTSCAIFRGTVAVMRFLTRFGWHLFVRIHSEKRLICAADALLGATIGHLAGKTSFTTLAIAAVAGYLLGFVNYALVTERWLRPAGYIQRT